MKYFLTAVFKKDIIWKNLHRRVNGVYKCDFTINHIKNNEIKTLAEQSVELKLRSSDAVKLQLINVITKTLLSK